MHEARSLIEIWAGAERRGGPDTLETILDEEFIGIGPVGFVLDKAQWIDRYRSGSLSQQKFDLSEEVLKEHGDTVIFAAKQETDASFRGQPNPFTNTRVLVTLVRKGDGWKVASVQNSAIRQPG